MDKRVIFAVAGSGKTTYIIDSLSQDKRSLIVTYTVGNYNNLFRAFKREFGITPGEYVRQFQERQKTKSDVH